MLAMLVMVASLGYGAGFEGYHDHKIYIGIYSPNAEYGWVVTDKSIYLDTVLQKR